ncbi:MAG TPA: hypothetical protein PK556_08785 [Smithellaceae bacterium]|jgi:hypothetical protein|nr:hypothetical protein [Smithellaceae bacterium]
MELQEIQRIPFPTTKPEEAIYFNGFAFGVGSGDMLITLLRQGVPVATMNASFPVLKTLAMQLGAAVADIERKMGQPVLTIDELSGRLNPNQGQGPQRAPGA